LPFEIKGLHSPRVFLLPYGSTRLSSAPHGWLVESFWDGLWIARK
jgi:hypothetical protein